MQSEIEYVITHIERVTKRFYARFKAERAAFLTHVQGIRAAEDCERYTSWLLHRLMFLYFLQQKGFLDGDTNYLIHRLDIIQAQAGRDTFYRYFLLPLFRLGLGRPERTPALHTLLGNVPYLDGDLFTEYEIQHRYPTIQIPDEAFSRLFSFFASYQWHLGERLVEHDNEITPAVLGYIFEKHINQQQMGAYYTKEDVTGYIASTTIIPCLFDAVEQRCPVSFRAGGSIWQPLNMAPERYIYPTVSSENYLPGETTREYTTRRTYYTRLRDQLSTLHSIDDFITYNLNIRQFAQDSIRAITESELLHAFYTCLSEISILDPTCGSGAFLFAALDVLQSLYAACLESMDKSADAINRVPTILKSIITHNLYGVDIMEQATDICKLRLCLKLLSQVERVEEIEALVNVNYHIRTGNALVGFVRTDLSCPLTLAELDHALASAYGIDPDDTAALQRWRASHQPFHWYHEFEGIRKKGGFDVIVGNPPYVEYHASKFAYTLRGFETLACANLYTCVVERSRQLLSPHGRHGMILPLAAFGTKNMIPFIEGFQRWFPTSWLSFYHFRPSMLFSGGKIASIPTAIYLAKTTGPEQRFSTRLCKWPTEQRDLLFSCLTYCPITAPGDPENRHYYPKFGQPLENTIMQKLLRHQRVGNYLANAPNQNTMYYRSAGGLYWKVFINFPWPYQTTSNKHCSFQQSYERDVFVALYNSSLFWWYYTVTFDSFNLKDYMLFGFRFSYPQDAAMVNCLQEHCQRLMHDFRVNAQHLKRSQTGSYTVYVKKAKAIIDEIDCVLACHYGFSDEELDFILNYDIKYRMG